jgi:hypothetical protein
VPFNTKATLSSRIAKVCELGNGWRQPRVLMGECGHIASIWRRGSLSPGECIDRPRDQWCRACSCSRARFSDSNFSPASASLPAAVSC